MTPTPPYVYTLVLVKPEGKTLYLMQYSPLHCLNTSDITRAMQFNTGAAVDDYLNRVSLPNKYHKMLFYNCGNNIWNPNKCGAQSTTAVG